MNWQIFFVLGDQILKVNTYKIYLRIYFNKNKFIIFIQK
jgi:hypothetical protein